MCKIKTDTDLCSFCNRQPESLEHLFFNCEIVRKFWSALTIDLQPHIDLHISLENISSKSPDNAEIDTVKASEPSEVDVNDNEIVNIKVEDEPLDEDQN